MINFIGTTKRNDFLMLTFHQTKYNESRVHIVYNIIAHNKFYKMKVNTTANNANNNKELALIQTALPNFVS